MNNEAEIARLIANRAQAIRKDTGIGHHRAWEQAASQVMANVKVSNTWSDASRKAAAEARHGHGYTHAFISQDQDGSSHVKPFKSEDDAWAEHSLAKGLTGPKKIALMRIKSDDTHEAIKDRVQKSWPESKSVTIHGGEEIPHGDK